MKQKIKNVCESVKAFDKKHTNFSDLTYWMLFLAASAVWLDAFNKAAMQVV